MRTRLAIRPSVAAFGQGDEIIVSPDQREALRSLAAPEHWGEDDSVLLRYLDVHVRLAVEQGLYVWSGDQVVVRAGQLLTSEGVPICVGFTTPPWVLGWAGERPSTVEILKPADLGAWPALDPRAEVVVAIDQFRSPELAGLSLHTQGAGVVGAVSWSLRRGLAVRHLRGSTRGYFAPVHLRDREAPPELVAAIHVQSSRLIVRALIDPQAAYPVARAVVEPGSSPEWLREAWEPVP